MKKFEVITDMITLPIDDIIENLQNGNDLRVQYSKNIYKRSELIKLNQICLNYGVDFCVRFYSHNSGHFDCAILEDIPNVKRLYIDTDKVTNMHSLSKLNKLLDLQFSVLNIDNYDFLEYSNIQNVEKLDLGRVYSKRIDLKLLQHFRKLNNLRITGKVKNIDSIGEVKNLQSLHLISIGKSEELKFINNLKELKILNIFRGGRENIDEVDSNKIEELQIFGVLGLKSLENLSKFTNLKVLKIDEQVRLSEIDLSNNIDIENIKILDCKTLNSINGLSDLIKLNKLAIGKSNINFESLIEKGLPPNLKEISFYNLNSLDKEIKAKIKSLGYEEYKFR